MSGFTFSKENEKYFENLLKRYPEKSSLTLPCLWMAQYQEGWISPEVMEYLANKLETSPMEIYSVASFYTMFNLKPIGTYHIQICKTLSCALRGSEQIKRHLVQKLGINVGQSTKDMRFTLSEVECLGSCGTAPCVCINEDYVQNATTQKLDELLDGLSK
ncbi:MAG: NAD(P)H-dependent oxidoreductase subunit E [Sulfurospirillaceae bacterium]|nr:NAD(P)H-dependent oxidoreductase subunit E [Sulfurospirillaceae bacterium]MDD3463441.1 NAD(P)H-dependent oxidoreductase subunit E [Sulfurospirillaceae bacterium]